MELAIRTLSAERTRLSGARVRRRSVGLTHGPQETRISSNDTPAQENARLRRQLGLERQGRLAAERNAARAKSELRENVAALAGRTRELEAIVAMGRELAVTLEASALGDVVARHIAQAVQFDECGLYSWDRPHNMVLSAGYYPPAGKDRLSDEYSLAEYPETLRVLVAHRQSVTNPADPAADASEVRFLRSLGGSLMVQLPMLVNGQAIGTVELLSRSGDSLDPGQVDVAQSMANEAGVMLEHARLYEQLRHEALHDPLTGLPNRILFGDRLEHALALGRGPDRRLVGLLFIDVDDFKVINDTSGHDVGDEVLKAIAERLGRLVRPGDTVARLSGDEFAVLVEDIDNPEVGIVMATRIVDAFQTPIHVRNRDLAVTVSVGIDWGTGATRQSDELIRNGDFAMYQAKKAGKARSRTYAATDRAAADERSALVADLRTAVARSEFVLFYQPIVDLRTGAIRGFEALVRWQHPDRGLLMPALFIPIAEDTGAIVEIGAWVLRRACEDFKGWQAAGPDLSVSVNVSGRQLRSPRLVDLVRRVLRRTGIPPHALILEVTETVLVADPKAADVLKTLKALGVRIAIDDFGTGYSSISYLRRFPVDILKIDREFVQSADSPEGTALLQGIIGLGRSVGLDLVAEGIEEPEQAAVMVAAACQEGQGYLYARPMSAAAISGLLRRGKPLADPRVIEGGLDQQESA